MAGANGVAVATALGAPGPQAVIALTRTNTVVPLVRPINCAVTAVDPVFANASTHVVPFVDVSTRYPVIGVPPFTAGATHISVIAESDATALDQVGAADEPNGVAIATFDGVALTPANVSVRTRNRYSEPFVSPVTTALVAGLPVSAITVV